MPRLRPLVLLATAAALAAPSAAQAGTTSELAGVQVTGIGTGVTDAEITADLTQARALRARVVRTDITWGDLEPREDAYDDATLAKADHLFAAARARGIKVLLTVVGTPCWNTVAPAPAGECATDEQRHEAQRHQPRDLAEFAEVAAFLAGRYGRDLAAFEVWNEPDQRNELYWAGPDKVKRYAEMLRLAYPAIKQASPSTTVLAGAIVGGNGAFLEALYKEGIKGSYDALSVHFYDLALYQLGTIRAMRDRYDKGAPLWLAEYGYTSCLRGRTRTQEGGHACVTRANQAKFTLDVLRALRRQRDVKGAIAFQLRDNDTYDFGVLDRRGRRKPLFAALKRAFTGKPGKARRVALRLRRRGGRVVASGSGPAGDLYQLEAFVGRTLRYRALVRPDRHARFSLKLPGAVGTRNVTVRVRPYTVGGRFATRRIG